MAALVSVAKAGGFSAASRETGIPLATLRRRVADLEAELGVPLLVLADRMVDFIEEPIDLALRIAELADSPLIARTVGTIRMVVSASPEYLGSHGAPKHPSDLAQHDWGRSTPGGFARAIRIVPFRFALDSRPAVRNLPLTPH
jgi:DNA-binding transcriptional LysR family regulator